MKKILSFIWETAKIVFIALLIVIPIRYFIFEPFIVMGASMEPNFHHKDYLIVEKISYRFGEPQRGEIVVFKHSEGFDSRYIKRIIGLPGEIVEIRDGQVIISNQQGEKILNETSFLLDIQTPGEKRIHLTENEFFVLGDNRIASSDSRQWGALSEENIIGRVLLRAWPIDNLIIFETPVFNK